MCHPKYRQLCGSKDCDVCFPRSVAGSSYAHLWSYERNEEDPIRICAGSSENKYWFKCQTCGHFMFRQPRGMKGKDKCPFCNTVGGRCCGDPECEQCFSSSLASTPYAQYWDQERNGDITPIMIRKQSQQRCYFRCKTCNHSYNSIVFSFCGTQGCMYCMGKDLCTDEDCQQCFNRSFASSPFAKYWDFNANNGLTPRQVCGSSRHRGQFICPECDKPYEQYLHTVAKGVFCGCLKNKTEAKLYTWFREHNYDPEPQFKIARCNRMSYDFCLHKFKLIIELDGLQHFEQVGNWKSGPYVRHRDAYKILCARAEGYTIIHLLQNDVWRNLNDWEAKLTGLIKQYEKPQIIFIHNGDTYNEHLGTLKNMSQTVKDKHNPQSTYYKVVQFLDPYIQDSSLRVPKKDIILFDAIVGCKCDMPTYLQEHMFLQIEHSYTPEYLLIDIDYEISIAPQL